WHLCGYGTCGVGYAVFGEKAGGAMSKISQNQLTITTPTLAHKTAILNFRQEFNAKFDEMHGSNELNAFTDGGFVGWLNYINTPKGTEWFEYSKVSDGTYIALLEDKVVGIMHLRFELNEILLERGGHLGYSTHPDFWGRGIASCMVNFSRTLFKEKGLNKILITCYDDNLASKTVILNNGGVLENAIQANDKTICRYWITLADE
ncbi:MAG: GNAT family N-acetyltransferase, partial [Moraxella sp.]|nr:GNAT family N-acetyltransferase [Moraxella sp.]